MFCSQHTVKIDVKCAVTFVIALTVALYCFQLADVKFTFLVVYMLYRMVRERVQWPLLVEHVRDILQSSVAACLSCDGLHFYCRVRW